jgi:predicted Zn-dependent peptidase
VSKVNIFSKPQNENHLSLKKNSFLLAKSAKMVFLLASIFSNPHLFILLRLDFSGIMVDAEFQFHQLKNGIRIIHQEVKSDVGYLGVIVNAGSRDEEEQDQGIAHFIEHSIFKGTKKRKAYHVLSRIEDVGGELNAYTTKEETTLYASFLSEDYERAVELLSDILFNSIFPEKELEREKEVVMEEINSFKDSPAELIFDEFDELVFDGHPIAWNILGTPEKLKTFNRKKIVSFISKNYNTDQIVVSSVGKISFQKLVLLTEKYFGWAGSNPRSTSRLKFGNYVPGTRSKTMDTFQAHCVLGNVAFSVQHPQRIALVLLNNLIGGQASNSRLNLALRERKGMAYNVESNYTAYSDTGIFSIYFGTDKENLEKALQIVHKEFQLLREAKLGLLQLSKAKKQLIGQLAIAADNHEELMTTIGKSCLIFDRVDPMDRVFEKIEAVTASEILEVANIILDKGKLSQLVYT